MGYRLPAHLHRNRHGALYFRLAIPNDIQHMLGQKEIYRSLDTSSVRQAADAAQALRITLGAIFRELRSQPMPDDEQNAPAIDWSRFEITNAVAKEKARHWGKIEGLQAELAAEISEGQRRRRQHERELDVAIKSKGEAIEKPSMATITSDALFEDFFREGSGDGRWKDVETTRARDYGPIWRKFAKHADVHGLTVAATKAYRAEVLADGVSPETKNRNLYRVHAVIAHGVDHLDLDPKMLTPLKRPKGKGRGKGGRAKSYLPFSDDELNSLFHSDAYQNNTFKKPSHYWLPMLGLYTGARLEELAGLHLSALTTCDGFPAMLLSDHETTDEGKNEYARRYMPIHSELIQAGLLDYVEQLKREGHERLFPEIGAAARDGFAKRATVDFTAYRRSVGVGKDKGERSREVFHSFRATLSGKLFHLGVDGDLSRRLTGHAANDVHGGVYLAAVEIPMERATEVMSRVTFGLTHPVFVDLPAYAKARGRKPSSPKRQAP